MGSRLSDEDGVAVNVGAKSNLDEVVAGEDVRSGGLVGRGRREVLEGAVDGEAGRECDAFARAGRSAGEERQV